MSQPFTLGDLRPCDSLESTIDQITNLSVDGATDFLLCRAQLPFLKEMSGLSDQDRRLWLQLEDLANLPSLDTYYGLNLSMTTAEEMLSHHPEIMEGKAVLLRTDSYSAELLLPLVHQLREIGAREIALEVIEDTPSKLLTRARSFFKETKLPLHLCLQGSTNEEDLEQTALALGYMLERGWVHSLSLGSTWERPGSGFARSLLNALELRRFGINYVSCPTCGRCRVDLESITNEVKERTRDVTAPLTVAIMGCEVNGPGEARHADVGIASGTESGLLIEDGQAVAKYKESELVDVLVKRIHGLAETLEV
jgi:hypothetical protein